MITLDQFKFRQHPNHPRAIEGVYKTDTHEFRVVAGPGFNSSPGGIKHKNSVTDLTQVESFEFVVGSTITMSIVYQAGWQTEEDINKYLEELTNKRVI